MNTASSWLKIRGTIELVILDVMGVISTYGTSSLKGTINVNRYLKVSKQHMFPSRNLFAYLSERILNHILHLKQQHGFAVEKSECSAGLPAVQPFTN